MSSGPEPAQTQTSMHKISPASRHPLLPLHSPVVPRRSHSLVCQIPVCELQSLQLIQKGVPNASLVLGVIAAVASTELSLLPDGGSEIICEASFSSEELDEVNDEMWASTLLFFIGKEQTREKESKEPKQKEASPPPIPKSRPQQESPPPKLDKKATKRMRRRGHFPKETTDLLKQWLFEHMDHPYPTEEEKVVVWIATLN
jgi:hypothetical protein